MPQIAPAWAFSAHAMPALADPHLARGIHLRLQFPAALGLPAGYFTVYRIIVRRTYPHEEFDGPYRSDVLLLDQGNRPLTLPFRLAQGARATGRIPHTPTSRCGWLKVTGDAGLQVGAQVNTPRGAGIFATARQTSPYVVTAPSIDQIVITGPGEVRAVEWLDPQTVFRFPLGPSFRNLALPVAGGSEYVSVPDFEAASLARVSRGAPLRLPMYDAPAAAGPPQAPPATAAQEISRVEQIAPRIKTWLAELLADPTRQWGKVRDLPLVNRPGETVQVEMLGGIMQAALDPGIARRLGFADVDTAPPATAPDEVIAYAVRGVFAHLDRPTLGARSRVLDRFLTSDPSQLAELLGGASKAGATTLPFTVLWAVGLASATAGPAAPQAPRPAAPTAGDWLPVAPPAAEREIRIPVSQLSPAGAIAFARQQATGVIALNDHMPGGRAIPLVAEPPAAAGEPGLGVLTDRHAPPEAVGYRLAQCDMFGRWSPWAEVIASAKERPGPPRPQPQVFYLQPRLKPGDVRPTSGQIRVRIAVPRPDALAPATLPLAGLITEVTVAGTTTPTVVNSVIDDPANPPETLIATIAGPLLVPTESRQIQVICWWRNPTGRSQPSAAIVRVLHDPRPPAGPAFSADLRYASRPDVTDLARVTISWTAPPGSAAFRVFYTDETRLIAWLGDIPAGDRRRPEADAILAAHAAAGADRAARAIALATHRRLFGREVFELLATVTAAAGHAAAFSHQLSGSLKVLSFYRVTAVSAAEAESAFADAVMVPVAVPNAPPPIQPRLVLASGPSGASPQVRLLLTVPPGQSQAARYRLRRSAVTGEAIAMMVASEGEVPPAAPGTAQELQITDAGPLEADPAARLAYWTSYRWRAEVQGPPEGGSDLRGSWSPPSGVVTATPIPDGPPATVKSLTVGRRLGGVDLAWSHPEPLRTGTAGGYRIEIYRCLPADAERMVTSYGADIAGARSPDGVFRWRDKESPPVGTKYRVIVVDPIGRSSPPCPFATVRS